MLPTLQEKAIKSNTMKFLKKHEGVTWSLYKQAVIEELKLNYIPYWLCPFNSNTHYCGVKQSVISRKVKVYGSKAGTTPPYIPVLVYKPEEGDFARSGGEKIIARKHTAFYGFNNFEKKLKLDNIEVFDFNKIKSLNAEFINAEVNPVEASREAFGRIEDENRRIANERVIKLVRFNSKIEVHSPIYVHVPLWLVRYKFKNKVYKVSVIGDSGTILKGEIPLTLRRRAANYFAGLSLIIAGAFAGQYGLSILNNVLSTSSEPGYVLMILGAAAIVISFALTLRAFRTQLEKSDI